MNSEGKGLRLSASQHVHLAVDDARTAQVAGAELIEKKGGGPGVRLSQGRRDGDVAEPLPGEHRT